MEAYVAYTASTPEARRALAGFTARMFYEKFCGGRSDTGRHLNQVSCSAEIRQSGIFTRIPENEDLLANVVADNFPYLEPETVVKIS